MITKKMRSNFICWFILSVLLITVTSCEITEPETIDYHNKILFTSSRSGKNQLYMMNPDGTNMIQITSGEYWHSNGRWSPDASMIVCNTEERTTTAGMEMVVMNSDGSNRTLLGYGNQMCWDPVGNKILYTYGPLEVAMYIDQYSIEVDGQNRQVISKEFAGVQTFSPDGAKIALAFNQDTLKGIVILDYPGFDNPLYININPEGAYSPFWAPDGNEIVFSSRGTPEEPNSIYFMNTDGTNIRKIINNTSELYYYYPRFSPEGSKIIFIGFTIDGTESRYLFMVNKDGTDLHKVIDDEYVTSCDWSK